MRTIPVTYPIVNFSVLDDVYGERVTKILDTYGVKKEDPLALAIILLDKVPKIVRADLLKHFTFTVLLHATTEEWDKLANTLTGIDYLILKSDRYSITALLTTDLATWVEKCNNYTDELYEQVEHLLRQTAYKRL